MTGQCDVGCDAGWTGVMCKNSMWPSDFFKKKNSFVFCLFVFVCVFVVWFLVLISILTNSGKIPES